MLSQVIRRSFSKVIGESKICVIGGGTGGLNFVAQMRRESGIQDKDFTVFEPSSFHFYQPGWTLVSGGVLDLQSTVRNTKDVFPSSINVINKKITKVLPEENTLVLESGDRWKYEQLVIAAGNVLDYSQIKGAQEALEDPDYPVGSAYKPKYAAKQLKITQQFKGGKYLFTEPQMPIKCGGAPQKVLFLADDLLRQQKVRGSSDLFFYCAKDVTFGVPKYSKALEHIHDEKGIKLNHRHKLVEIKKEQKVAVFQQTGTNNLVEVSFDALHIVPPQVPPAFIKESGLGDAAGYTNVNQFTMQHLQYKNIWGIGDSCSAPTSKTAAAVFGQTPVLVENLKEYLKGRENLTHIYDGYTSCPIPVGQNKLMLCEFKYNGEVDETFPIDQSKPNQLFFFLKAKFFPFVYWNLVPQGYWYGRKSIIPLFRKIVN